VAGFDPPDGTGDLKMKFIPVIRPLVAGVCAALLVTQLSAAESPWSRSLFNGLAQIIVQSTRSAGEIKLTAPADGLAPATAMVQTQPCVRPSMP
jgi:hypothetical protein